MNIENKTKRELIKLVKHYKKLAKTDFLKIKNRFKILSSLNSNEIDLGLREFIDGVLKRLDERKVEKPKSFYKFPNRNLTKEDIASWFVATENLYFNAKRYETQERGNSCSVDRAYKDWLVPESKKLLNKIKKLGIK